MNISPVNFVNFKSRCNGKSISLKAGEQQEKDVVIGSVYNKHIPDKSASYARVDYLGKTGRKLVHRIDNTTNILMKEFEAIGQEAERLQNEFTPELYFKIKDKNEGKVVSNLPKGYIYEDTYNKVIKTECNEFGIVNQKIAKYRYNGTLDNVIVRKQRMGNGDNAIFDEERYEFNETGRLKRYTIGANAATKEGYNCEERTFDFSENPYDGKFDIYRYSSSTGEYGETKKAASSVFYSSKTPVHVNRAEHINYDENGIKHSIKKYYNSEWSDNRAHFIEEDNNLNAYTTEIV